MIPDILYQVATLGILIGVSLAMSACALMRCASKMSSVGAMSRREALAGRAEMLMMRARKMAAITADVTQRFGVRYEAAVLGDHCLDLAREYDDYIREHCSED